MAEETIRVTMEADSTQLQAEFRKAQVAAQDFAQRTLPMVESELNQAFLAQQKMNQELRKTAGVARGAGTGLLQLAYFADDVQYGVRGILNNIPGLVMGFGAGAGLAGALSIATLAAAALWPQLQRIYGDGERKKLEEMTEAAARRFDTEMERIREMDRERALTQEIADYRSEMERISENELRIQTTRIAGLEAEARLAGQMRGIEDQLARARAGVRQAALAGATGPDGVAAQRAAANEAAEAARQAEIRRLQEDVQRNREIAKAANEEYDRLLTSRQNIEAANEAGQRAASAEVDRLRRDLAAAEAAVEKAELERQETGASNTANLFYSSRRRDEIKDELARQEAVLKALEEQAEVDAARAETVLRSLSEKIAAAQTEREQTELTLAARRQIAELERARERIETAQAVSEAAKEEAEAKQRAAESEKWLADAEEGRQKRQREKAATTARNRGDFLAQIKELELRRAGRDREADALAKERRLRNEAVGLAKALNIEEEKALELLRRKAALEDEVSRRGTRRGSRIGGDRPGSGLRRVSLQAARGLGTSVAEREAAARRLPDMSAANSAANYFQRSLTNEETMIAIFKKLGLA